MTEIALPTHHPDAEHLLDYASGAIDPAAALALATHLTFCPACRDHLAHLEAIGGSLLDELTPEPVSAGSRAAVLDRLDTGSEPRPAPRARRVGEPALPRALEAFFTGGLDSLPWRRLTRTADEAVLPIADSKMRARLLRVKPGGAIPQHTHRGTEMVAVLAGGFSDSFGMHRRGDLATHDENAEHRPVATQGEDCLCLVVDEAPVRLTGVFGRFLNPFMR